MKLYNNIQKSIIKHKLNNQGSTLLTVIVCIAFIGILCSLMLSVTMTNLQMKLAESKSKKTFYSGEAIMEKIKTAAQDILAISIEEVYRTEVLTNYAAYLDIKNETDRNALLQKKVMVKFLSKLCDVSYSQDKDVITGIANSSEEHPLKTGYNYFTENGYLSAEELGLEWDWGGIKVVCETIPSYAIRIKNVQIKFEKEGYRSAIASDIVVTMPNFSFSEGTDETYYKMTQPFQQYVLVADGAINSDMAAETTNITGNIYSGSGINIDGRQSGNHTVHILADTIITRGDIKVGDTATLNIDGKPPEPLTPTKPVTIWANNMLTYTSDDYVSGFTNLKINGICAIKDDLTLDGLNSNVTINGAYIGYTGKHDRSGSSIIVNGAGSGLNLSGLNELILAGRAHVLVQDNAINKNVNITTGESLAFKSNQRAYLMPADFLSNINHNPITVDDPFPVIDIKTKDGIEYPNYVVAATPYKIAAKQTGPTVLRYYFLNFGSGRLADSFFKAYYDKYPSTLQNMKPFNLKSVILPDPLRIKAVGNVMSYNSVSGELRLTAGLSGQAAYPDDASLDNYIATGFPLSDIVYDNTIIKDKNVGSFADMYSKLTHLLSIDSTRAYDDTGIVEAMIINTGVGRVANIENDINLSPDEAADFVYRREAGDAAYTTTDTKKQFWVIDGNVTINNLIDPDFTFNGIIIATGDITVCNGAKIKGLLISTGEKGTHTITLGNNVTLDGRIVTTGNINLGQKCTLEITSAVEAQLNNIFNLEGAIFNCIFKNTEMSVDYTIKAPADNLVDLSGMVSYENWRKIE